MSTTTIEITVQTREALKNLKVHKNQSYDEVIIGLVNRKVLQDEAAKNMKGMKKL